MNRTALTVRLCGSGLSHPRASDAFSCSRVLRVVFRRHLRNPASTGTISGVPGPKHVKVQTKAQLVSSLTRGPPLRTQSQSKIAWSAYLDDQVTCPDPCFSSLSNHAPMPCKYYSSSSTLLPVDWKHSDT